jgi:hypothetical protein
MPAFVIHAESPFDDVRYGYEILLVGWAGLFIGQAASLLGPPRPSIEIIAPNSSPV